MSNETSNQQTRHITEIVNLQIGENIGRLRDQSGLSRSQFEEAAGLPRGSCRTIEQGTRSVSAGELSHIAHVLGVAPAALFDGLRPQPTYDGAISVEPMADADIQRLLQFYSALADPEVRVKLLRLFQATADAIDKATDEG